jgi:hypothetical protein
VYLVESVALVVLLRTGSDGFRPSHFEHPPLCGCSSSRTCAGGYSEARRDVRRNTPL